jgi:antitoxin ParD1/3/4
MNLSYYLAGTARELTMPSPEKRTFSLPTEQASYIDTLVASGTYASGSEVVRAGLRALQERDAAVERWLQEEVIGVCDAMQADPSRAIPAEQVFATIRARHADRLKKKRRESQD